MTDHAPDDATDAPDDATAHASGGPSCACKLGRVARSRGLVTIDRRLRERRADGASLRDLERVVNVALLDSALRGAAVDVVDGGAVYDGLAGEDASAGERTELRRRLAREGVDVDAVLADFVSYQTVRSHLRDCLGIDTGRQPSLDAADGKGTIEWARARSEGIVGRTLQRLARDGEITAGDLDVTHAVRVTCTRCGTTTSVGSFVEAGGCDCGPDAAGTAVGDTTE